MKATVLPVVFLHDEPLPAEFVKAFAEHLGDAIEDFAVLYELPCAMAIAIKKPITQETMQ